MEVPNNAFASSFVLKSEKPQRNRVNYCSKQDAMGRTQVFDWFTVEGSLVSATKDGALGAKQNKGHISGVFFYFEGIVHHEYAPDGQTINKEFHLEVLPRLRESVR